MNGPYHYGHAERGIEYALSADEDHSHEDVMRILAVAQVHATLANAAAAAENIRRNGGTSRAWIEALEA